MYKTKRTIVELPNIRFDIDSLGNDNGREYYIIKEVIQPSMYINPDYIKVMVYLKREGKNEYQFGYMKDEMFIPIYIITDDEYRIKEK